LKKAWRLGSLKAWKQGGWEARKVSVRSRKKRPGAESMAHGVKNWLGVDGKIVAWRLFWMPQASSQIEIETMEKRISNPPPADCKYRIMNVEVMYSARRELLCRTVYFKKD
jgi:hypothetical protein